MGRDLAPGAHSTVPLDWTHGAAVVEQRTVQRDDARLLDSVL